MKIGIVALNDPRGNYGNKLQNFAVQETYKKLFPGVAIDTLYVDKEYTAKEWLKWNINKAINYRLTGGKTYWKYVFSRKYIFKQFSKKYYSIRYVKRLDMLKNRYDYFSVGSDQTWNPLWYDERAKEFFLLTFARPEQKVCFSPSFGISQLPNEWKQWFRINLSTFRKISVREETGAKIVKDLTGKEATVLIDPTMMLDAEDWIKIAQKPIHIECNVPYILTYFLGDKSAEIEKDLAQYAEQLHAEIYNMLDFARPDLYLADPANFIYLIAHAQLVLTDSFHGSVFSFLFEKPLLIYQRESTAASMMSRIHTLIFKFDLERKYVGSGLPNDIMECDYSNGLQQLIIERQKVADYLTTEIGQ